MFLSLFIIIIFNDRSHVRKKGGEILLDKKKVGKAIAYLRKRAGYTQKDLADRIGISDKAVSKWERGLGMPDIAYFGKLSILLDTDTDSLLAGDVIHHDKEWRGLLVLLGNSKEVGAGTSIYDKPLVYFLLSYFLLVGIKQIYIVCDKRDQNDIQFEFGDGKEFGMKLYYCGQKMEEVIHNLEDGSVYSNMMVVFGKSFIYGVDQTRFFQRAMAHKDRITILSLPKKREFEENNIMDSNIHGIRDNVSLSFDGSRRLVSSDSEEKIHTQYDYYEIPVLFCPKDKLPNLYTSTQDDMFAINLSKCRNEQLYTEILDRGFVEMPIENRDQVLDVSGFIRLVQKACGMEIYCLEEIAWRRGMISLNKLKEFGLKKQDTNYGKYILSLTKRYDNAEV